MPNQILEYILAIIEDVDDLKWQEIPRTDWRTDRGYRNISGEEKKRKTQRQILHLDSLSKIK